MMPITEYKVLSGTTAQLNEQLPENVMQGWKPNRKDGGHVLRCLIFART